MIHHIYKKRPLIEMYWHYLFARGNHLRENKHAFSVGVGWGVGAVMGWWGGGVGGGVGDGGGGGGGVGDGGGGGAVLGGGGGGGGGVHS